MSVLNCGQLEIPVEHFPSLKTGVQVLEIPHLPPARAQIFVGTSRGGVLFSELDLLPLLSNLDGTYSVHELLTSAIFSSEQIANTLAELHQANLLVLSKKTLRITPTFESESHRISELRLRHEAQMVSWYPRTSTDGRNLVQARSDFSILLFGTSRLAIALFSILHASGFSQTKIIPGDRSFLTTSGRRENSSHIKVDEICGLNVLLSDVGKSRGETLDRILNSAELLPRQKRNFPQIPHLVISTETAQPDYIQRWMSEGVSHLQISNRGESFLEVGPIVLPGNGPCLRCVELQKFGMQKIQGLVELYNSLESQPELSSASAAAISGFVASIVIQLADTGQSPLTHKSVRFNLLDISNPEHIYWQPHIFCGCLEVI